MLDVDTIPPAALVITSALEPSGFTWTSVSVLDSSVFPSCPFFPYASFSSKDFDPAHPVYKVKVWDADGNVTERMVDISKVDPGNCDTVDMYAYAVLRQASAIFAHAPAKRRIHPPKALLPAAIISAIFFS